MNPNKCDVQLKRNDFQTNLPLSLQDFRESRDFSDVTLVCDEDTVFEAHQIILVAGSLFFEKVLRCSKTRYHLHPLLYLAGFRKSEVSALLDYLYTGEASIQTQYLNSFLSMAQQLGIRGLMEETNIEKPEDQHEMADTKPCEFYQKETFFENEIEPEKARNMKFIIKNSIDKPEQPPIIKGPKPAEPDAINTSFEHKITPTSVKNRKSINDNNHMKGTVCALQTEVHALQKEILMQEAADRSNWILQSVSTFPKLPMEMKELMSK